MSAHVLLNLFNELGKSDKMQGLPSILSLFRNEFNKFNNTSARMLDSIYHMNNTLKSRLWCKNIIILSSCTQRCYGRHNISRKSINHLWFIDFIAWRYFTTRCDVIWEWSLTLPSSEIIELVSEGGTSNCTSLSSRRHNQSPSTDTRNLHKYIVSSAILISFFKLLINNFFCHLEHFNDTEDSQTFSPVLVVVFLSEKFTTTSL